MIRDTEPQSRDELVLLPDLRDALPAGEAAYLAEDSIREGSLAQAVADLSGEVRDLPDGGILFEDELPVLVCEDLQRVEILDLYGSMRTFWSFFHIISVAGCNIRLKTQARV